MATNEDLGEIADVREMDDDTKPESVQNLMEKDQMTPGRWIEAVEDFIEDWKEDHIEKDSDDSHEALRARTTKRGCF